MLRDIEEIRFTARSEENLRGVHPDLVRVIRLALRYSLVPFSVSEGCAVWRASGNGARRQLANAAAAI